jgi:hypothetical protein
MPKKLKILKGLKEFLTPEYRRIIAYLLFIIIFMSETLLIRYVYRGDYIVLFLLDIYHSFFKYYVDFFTVAFFYYLIILTILYLLSCIVILITEKIKK